MTLPEIAEWFGVHPRTIARWVAEGRLTGFTDAEVMRFEDEYYDARATCARGHDREGNTSANGHCKTCDRERKKVGV